MLNRLPGLASVALATLLQLGCEEVLEQPAPQAEASSTAPAQTPDSPTDTAPAQTSDPPSPTISWLTDAQLEALVD